MKPVAISLCDLTGNMMYPWAEAGFECWCVDVQHSIRRDRIEEFPGGGSIHYVWGDIRSWCPPEEIRKRLVFGAGFPPCTDVTVAGARDFRKKRNVLLRDALELFAACEMVFSWAGVPYMIENPVGKFSDHMGSPDYTFQPWEYGDMYQKKTCLWAGNGFVMPEKTVTVKPEGVRQDIWLMSPGPDRANKRSETPMGFARAVFTANAPRIMERMAA